MFRQDSLHQPFLNNSNAADQEHRIQNIKMNKGMITCQICSNLRFQNQMYAVSENCQPMHSFCYQCLIQRLEESMKKNQDMSCPVDSCPFILTETSRFFSKLPNNLHNKYVAWKASVQYLGRNKSFRQSRREEYENYFNPVPQERIQQNQIVQPKERQNHEKNPIKEKKKKQRKPKQKKAPIDQDIKQQQRQIPILQQKKEAPIPFHNRPQPAANINIPAVVQIKQQFVEIPYNCKHRFVKFVYIVFGLPLLFIMMGLMLVYMLFIYAFMIGMVLISMIALVAGGFCLTVTITESNQEDRNKYIVYTLLLGFIQIIGASFTRFFMNHLGGINKYFIKNLWLWWIQKLINIWMYPSPPFVLKQNIVNEQPINERPMNEDRI